jgi:multidrug efflux pump subunit AcrA (membrane-fusion protein)
MSDWDGLVAERKYRMAIQPWNEVITELRVDRGMLIGSSQFTEDMTGVERVNALTVIDAAIKTANGWIEHYRKDRDRIQGGILNVFKTKKIQSMTDEELGEI